jgi:hypothetical protein
VSPSDPPQGSQAGPTTGPGRRPAPFDRLGEPIYAMMVTGDRPSRVPLARVAVASFAAQDHPHRILVVVKSGEQPLDLSAIPSAHRIVVTPAEPLPLGELRNRGLEAIPTGALWTYWDDDDWHHPSRLSTQRRVLDIMGVSACLLTAQVIYSLPHDIAYVKRVRRGFPATLLSRRDPRLRFRPVRIGEDTAYLNALRGASSWYPWRNPSRLMIRLFHGANTGDAATEFGLPQRSPGAWRLSPRSDALLRRVLELYRDRGVEVAPGP